MQVVGRTLLSVFALLFGAADVAFADGCLLQSETRGSQEIAYRDRGDRCEGTYRQMVASRVNLRIVGYHANRPPVNFAAYETLDLHVAGLEGSFSPWLKIESLRHSDYYQMDTRSVGSNGLYTWPLQVVKRFPEPPLASQLAAIACETECDQRKLELQRLLPVSFGSLEPTSLLTPMVIVLADVELLNLSASMYRSDNGEVIFEDKKIGPKIIPAHRPQKLRIGLFKGPGARLVLSGTTHEGRSVSYEAELLAVGQFD